MAILTDITSKYSRSDAWFYDRFIAPAVTDVIAESLNAGFGDGVLDRLPSGAKVLDVGCGGGQICLVLANRYPHLHFVGVDLSAEQIARAQSRKGAFTNVEFVVGDALALSQKDQSFQMVISIAALKHWPDKLKGLSECCRVLATGGKLVVVEANREAGPDDMARFVSGWHLPRWALGLAAKLFRHFVAGRSVSPSQVRSWSTGLPLKDCRVETSLDMPAGLRLVASRA